MKIVLIHGVWKSGFTKENLEKEWESALRDSFHLNKLDPNKIDPANIEFVYYADLKRSFRLPWSVFSANFDSKMLGIDLPNDLDDEVMLQVSTNSQEESEIAMQFALELCKNDPELTKELLDLQNIQPAQTVDGLLKTQFALKLIPFYTITAIVKILQKKFPNLTQFVAREFAQESYLYLKNAQYHNKVNQLLLDTLNEPCILIAHSLGSIVSYKVLSSLSQTDHIKGFITLGSPLGMELFNSIRANPLGVPSCIRKGHWVNFRAENDPIAGVLLEAPDYPIDPAITNTSVVSLTENVNPHSIEGYLKTYEVATYIDKLLDQK